jgi:hypothetical protein
MHLMHGTLSTIRGTRATPRFVRAASRGRRRRLGLDRVVLQAEPAADGRSSPLRPLAGSLRGWRGTVVGSARAVGLAALRRHDGPRWARGGGGHAARPEPYRAAPWRR